MGPSKRRRTRQGYRSYFLSLSSTRYCHRQIFFDRLLFEWSVSFGPGTRSTATNFEPDPDTALKSEAMQAQGSCSKFACRHSRTFRFVRIVKQREASNGVTIDLDPVGEI
jgi:hypothetical protein